MKRKQGINPILALLAVMALVLTMPSTGSIAGNPPKPGDTVAHPICGSAADGSEVIDPGLDPDNDNLTNLQECIGLGNNAGEYITFPGILNKPAGADRVDYLDPESRDVFLILIRGGGPECPPVTTGCTTCAGSFSAPLYDNDGKSGPESNIPMRSVYDESSTPPYYDPYAIISKSNRDNGLEIVVHEIEEDLAGRQVTDGALALRFVECMTPCGTILGNANQTMALDEGLFFSERIKSFICSKYSDYGVSVDDAVLLDTFIDYFQYIMAHEIGHCLNIATEYNASYHGWHLAPEARKVMEERSRVDVVIGSSVTFYPSTDFDRTNKNAASLQQ